MKDIPPFTETAAGSMKATRGNDFLVPQCVRYLQSYLDKGGYIMDTPHLVAYTTTRSCTTQDLGKVDFYYVKVVIKTIVQGSKTKYAIYVVDYGPGLALAAGVSKISGLYGLWDYANKRINYFASLIHANMEWTNPDDDNEKVTRAPDLCIEERNPNRLRGIVELEFKNRTVKLMRRDYAQYFYGNKVT